MAGQTEGAGRVREKLQSDFLASGAELLVTSCPICFRMFSEDYSLPGMKVLHHTQYIMGLLEWNRIQVDRQKLAAAYHEPCELGRGSGITTEPRELMAKLFQKDLTPEIEGLCCGGSLGAPRLDLATRRAVARGAYSELTAGQPDVLVTACPLCKKSFGPVSEIPVIDFAEAVARSLTAASAQPATKKSLKTAHRQSVAPYVDAGL